MRPAGISGWYGYFNDYAERVGKIKEAGLDGIMLWWEDEGGATPHGRREMVSLARETGLEIFNAHVAGTHENMIWCDDRGLREKHLFVIRDTICEIAEEDIFNLVIHLCESEDIPAPGLSLLKSIEYLLPFAEANRVTLSLENTWRADYLECVWDAFPGVKELGFCFDSSHAKLRGHFELLRDHFQILTALHLSDNDGREDRHWLPFDGEIDFEEKVFPYLLKTDVPLTMELIAPRKRYPKEAIFLREAKLRADKIRRGEG